MTIKKKPIKSLQEDKLTKSPPSSSSSQKSAIKDSTKAYPADAHFWIELGEQIKDEIKKYNLTSEKHYKNSKILHSIIIRTMIKPIVDNKLIEEKK